MSATHSLNLGSQFTSWDFDVALGPEHRDHMAVGQGADNFPGPIRLPRFATERAPNDIDEAWGKMGEIPKGFMFDLIALAIGSAEQVRLVDLAGVGSTCCGYMNWTISAWHACIIAAYHLLTNTNYPFLVATL